MVDVVVVVVVDVDVLVEVLVPVPVVGSVPVTPVPVAPVVAVLLGWEITTTGVGNGYTPIVGLYPNPLMLN